MPVEVCHVGARLEGEGDEAVRHVSFQPGQSLRDILATSTARVRSGCAGIGACGLCRVRVDAGDAGAATVAELLHVGEEALAAGVRLACQITPRGDMDVTVLQPARPSSWRVPGELRYQPAHPPSPSRANGSPLGVAVDVGTTRITVAICDVARGRHLAARSGPNPQGRLGADVIGRLDAATRSRLTAQQLRSWVVEAIGEALLDLSQGEGIALSAVGRVRVVGNSAMLTLLSGRPPGALLDPAGWTEAIACPLDGAGELAEAWELAPSVDIDLVQPLGGFVGSDLVSGVVHGRLMEGGQPALLVDFGTNSEIALWDGERLWATASAGGTAFEAAGIGCGMTAEPGAIRRLSRSAAGAWTGEVIDAAPPRGICGSGLVDALAILRAGGEIDERGRLAREPLDITVEGARFTLGKADVDQLQRAKAPVAAGVELLCRRAGLRPDGIGAVHVAGAFGWHLDVANAQRIGLLPPVPAERVRLAGNTALQGAVDLLLSDGAEAALARARQAATLVNLAMEEEFEELFVNHLHVRPMAGRS